MSETASESEDSVEPSASSEDVSEPAEMKLESAEVDHIELSQDGGETFERKSGDE